MRVAEWHSRLQGREALDKTLRADSGGGTRIWPLLSPAPRKRGEEGSCCPHRPSPPGRLKELCCTDLARTLAQHFVEQLIDSTASLFRINIFVCWLNDPERLAIVGNLYGLASPGPTLDLKRLAHQSPQRDGL